MFYDSDTEENTHSLRDWELADCRENNKLREAELGARFAYLPHVEPEVWRTVERLILRGKGEGEGERGGETGETAEGFVFLLS